MNNKKIWNILNMGLKRSVFNTNQLNKNVYLTRIIKMKFSEVININNQNENKFNIQITDNCSNVMKINFI